MTLKFSSPMCEGFDKGRKVTREFAAQRGPCGTNRIAISRARLRKYSPQLYVWRDNQIFSSAPSGVEATSFFPLAITGVFADGDFRFSSHSADQVRSHSNLMLDPQQNDGRTSDVFLRLRAPSFSSPSRRSFASRVGIARSLHDSEDRRMDEIRYSAANKTFEEIELALTFTCSSFSTHADCARPRQQGLR